MVADAAAPIGDPAAFGVVGACSLSPVGWRENDSRAVELLLSPVAAFPLLWLVAVALAQIHIVGLQTSWSAAMWTVALLVPVAFVAGGLTVTWLVDRRVVTHRARGLAHGGTRIARPTSPRAVLIALLVVGYAQLTHEFAEAGAVPLLSGHIDAVRVGIHTGPLGLLVDALTVAAVVAIAAPDRLFARAALPEVLIALVALAGFAIAGGRQALAIAAAGWFARVLYWRRIEATLVLAFVLLGVGAFAAVFYLRLGQEIGQAFPQELYLNVVNRTSPMLAPLVPLHLALAMNLAVLNKLVAYFPHVQAYGLGKYDLRALHSILPSRDLGQLTMRLTPPFRVATAAGPLWADGGLGFVAGGFLLIGAVSTLPHALFRRTPSFRYAVLAGYLLSLALYCLYDNLFTQYKDWVFVVAGLWLLGRHAERRAGYPYAPSRSSLTQARRSRRRSPWPGIVAVVCAAVIAWLGVIVIADHGVSAARRYMSSRPRASVTHSVESANRRRTAAYTARSSSGRSPASQRL